MREININEKIPLYDIWTIAIPDEKVIQIYFDYEKDTLCSWKELFKKIGCYIDKVEGVRAVGVVRIIAENSMEGKVYMLHNYGANKLWEVGTTEGYA